MSVRVEQFAAEAMRDWLLLQLPAKVAEVNATRAAVLKAPRAGPYLVPGGTVLKIAAQTAGTRTNCPLAGGAMTTAAIVTAINSAYGSTVASADAANRLVLTALVAPTEGDSVLELGDSPSNAAFGWPQGGQKVVRTPLVAPISSGVAMSWPMTWPDFGPGFWVMFGDRASKPMGQPNVRRDEYGVRLELAVMRVEPAASVHRDNEHINACLQCVREVIFTDAGRQLGQAGAGIQGVWESGAKVPSKPFSFKGQAPNGFVDLAQIVFDIRVFERPAAS